MYFAADTSDELRPFWQRRLLWVLTLLLIAVGYFGSYFQHGINFRDEGGTVTLLAKRVHDGEVPFRDVVLGYNVGWFFPIAGLFKLTGVSFVALRIYFFALSTLAALLAFLTVERAARHGGLRWMAPVLGFIVGVLLIVIPGMTFKNYNPLAAIANSWCLLGFVLAKEAPAVRWRALLGGLVLGATWLVRIDLGTFFTIIWLGTIFARLFDRELKARLALAAASLALLILGVAIPHGPVVWDAQRRGYLEPFLAAYPSQWQKLLNDLQKVSGMAKPAPAPAKPATASPGPVPPPPPAVASATPPDGTPIPTPPAIVKPAPKPLGALGGETLARTTWSSFTAAKDDKKQEVFGLFLLTYFPLLSMIPLVLWAGIAWLLAVARRQVSTQPLAALVLLGGALTMFPQYFFWRPDAPHLSEFGPGFWCGAVGALALLGGWRRSWLAPARWLAIFLVVHAAVWVWRMAPDRWCGTIAARSSRKVFFEGANGVRVFEQQKTVDWMKEVLLTVRERSSEHEYLVAYPYHPAFNVFTNRPTYEKNVYVDNATAGSRWSQDAIARIEHFKPRVVIISGYGFNGTPASRFKNWAGPVYDHVRAKYEFYGAFGDKKKDGTLSEEDTYELFIRRPDVIVLPKS